MYKFRLYWTGGETEIVYGDSFEDALRRHGIETKSGLLKHEMLYELSQFTAHDGVVYYSGEKVEWTNVAAYSKALTLKEACEIAQRLNPDDIINIGPMFIGQN